MSEPKDYVGEDGAKRNVLKLRAEGAFWFLALKGTVRDVFRGHRPLKNLHHNYVDIFVECRRASPYFSGHLAAITVPISVYCICYTVAQFFR